MRDGRKDAEETAGSLTSRGEEDEKDKDLEWDRERSRNDSDVIRDLKAELK